MFKRLDRSMFFAKLISSLSEFMAKRRGLPVVIGIVLIMLGLLIQVVNVIVPSQLLDLLGILTQSIGILTAVVGLLLAQPLGK